MEKKGENFLSETLHSAQQLWIQRTQVKHKPILCTGSGSFGTDAPASPGSPRSPRPQRSPQRAHLGLARVRLRVREAQSRLEGGGGGGRPARTPGSSAATSREHARERSQQVHGGRATGAGAGHAPAGASRLGTVPEGRPGPRGAGRRQRVGLGARDALRAALPPAPASRGSGSVSQETGHPSARDRGPLGEARAREDGAPLGGSRERGVAEPRRPAGLRRPAAAPGPASPRLPLPAAGQAGWPRRRAAAAPGGEARGSAGAARRRRAQGRGHG